VLTTLVFSCFLACLVLQVNWDNNYTGLEQEEAAPVVPSEHETAEGSSEGEAASAAPSAEAEAPSEHDEPEQAPLLNIYQRIDGGYAYKLRPVPAPKPSEHKDYDEPPPIAVSGSVFSTGETPIPQLEIPKRWYGELTETVAAPTLASAHGTQPTEEPAYVSQPAQDPAADEPQPVEETEQPAEEPVADKARMTSLLEVEDEADDEPGMEKEDMSFLDTPWMDEWMRYSKDILTPYEQKQFEKVRGSFLACFLPIQYHQYIESCLLDVFPPTSASV
jgi:hypothetical protein